VTAPVVLPSILSADFAHLARDVDSLLEAGATVIHCDVMDGIFVPPISFGAPVIASLRKYVGPGVDLDVHLMIDRPERHVEAIAEAGASGITFHAEATNHAHRVLQHVRELGCRAGLAVCPGTPLSAYAELEDAVDLALCMTVNPGWGGQKLIPATVDKARRLAELLPNAIIQVDGGVDHTSAPELAAAGAQWMVAGSAVFGSADPPAAYAAIRAAAASAAA
jgi:ribulose-phosphate 3-epimerase